MHNCFKTDEIGDQKASDKTPRGAGVTCQQNLMGFHNWLNVGNARERGIGDD